MSLNSQDTKILQEIVSAEGKCLDSKRCQRCPFRAQCLPEFLNPTPPSQPQRFRMAMEVLSHHFLIDEEMTSDEVEQEYIWEKK